jgi:MscS family membrane protein
MLLLLGLPTFVTADTQHPLAPPDFSSPRATLNTFLTTGDRALSLVRGDHWDNPSPESIDRLKALMLDMQSALDLSKTPPAAQWDVGRDAVFHLYEVLSRIELPSESDIPDSAAFDVPGTVTSVESEKTGGPTHPTSWTIPHTEISLVRIEEGPQQGSFLFSASTVAGADKFFQKVRELPYRRDVPLEHFADMRPYLSPLSSLISSRTIENFPDWLKRSIGGNAWWKLITMAGLSLAVGLVIFVIHRQARPRRLDAGSAVSYLRRLATPSVLLLAPSLIVSMNRQLNMTGDWSAVAQLLAEGVFYVALAWLLWAATLAIAEAIIASRYIRDRTLNAQLMRLMARALGTLLVLVVILHLSNRLGAPLYSIMAGFGVGGIVLALAVRPTVENFVGGLVLFSDKPVRIGDYCRFGDEYGTVEDIGMRSTRIRKRDDTVVTVPNSAFSQLQLTNLDKRRRRLYETVLGLRYETTPEQLRYVIAQLRAMLIGHPTVSPDQLHVRFAGFGAYSLDIRLFAYIRTRSWLNYKAVVEDINLRIMEIVADAGTGFAFPSQTTYLSRDGGLDKERGRQAEARVQAWRSEGQLPFPEFSEELQEEKKDVLDYPPVGSPDYKPPAASSEAQPKS